MVYVEDKTIQKYVERLSVNSRKNVKSSLRAFFTWIDEHGGEFSGRSPSELVAYQKAHPSGYELVDLVEVWIDSQTRLRANSKIVNLSRVKALFKHNRVALPEYLGFRIRSEVAPVRGTLTLEEVKRVVLASNPMYRAIFLSMFQGGMGRGELIYWSNKGYEELVDQLAMGARQVRVELPGRKQNRN